MSGMTGGAEKRSSSSVMTLTSAAIDRLQHLISVRGKPSVGVRIGVRSRGCSGLSYKLEYADHQLPTDERIDVEGVTVLIESNALLFLLGSEMDFVQEKVNAGFVFRNPNEKGRCGCGESFHV